MLQNGKIANINTTLKNLFFRWVAFTKPFHKLPPREQNVLSLLLYYNHIYKKDITKQSLRWKLVFDYDTKMLIKEQLGINDSRLQNILTSLRKKGCIKYNKVTPMYVPELDLDSKVFRLVFNFKIIDEKEEET